MGKKKFDLGAVNQAMTGSDSPIVTNTLSKIDNPQKQEISEPRTFKRISYKKLKPSPLNDYPIDDIEEMESLLLNYGLLQNFSVHYDEESDIYEIESGERRYTAMGHLFKKYENCEESIKKTHEYQLYQQNLHGLYIQGIPCNVETLGKDNDSVKARIIIHNETDRPYDPIRTAAKIRELSDIYTRKNMQLPKSERFNVNQRIAAELNGKYSERQIIRYKNFDDLTPELKNEIINNDLPISEASKLHSLTEDEQHILTESLRKGHDEGIAITLPTAEEVRESIREAEEESSYNFEDTGKSKLEQVKNEAAQKILTSKNKRENRIKDTVQILKKKTEQLLKDIDAYKSQNGKSPDYEELENDIHIIISNLSKI